MNEEIRAKNDAVGKPVVVHPGPSSLDDLLRYTDPAPDDETERFVSTICADRRETADRLSHE